METPNVYAMMKSRLTYINIEGKINKNTKQFVMNKE